jgi:hypothetical protein
MNDNTSLARATSAHFPALAMMAEEYHVCVIFLNQLRTNLNVKFGDPRKTTGGDAPGFYFSQRLWLSSAQIKNKEGEVIGNQVTGDYKKNKVSRPFQKAKWRFMFEPDGSGRFDRERSLIDYLEEVGVMEKGKPGFLIWEGKQRSRNELSEIIRKEGDKGFEKLKALLPEIKKPEVLAEVNIS